MDSLEIAKWEKEHAEQLAAWRVEFGDIATFPTRKGVVVFRAPSQDVYDRYLNRLSAQDDPASCKRELAQLSAVSHTSEQVAAIFERLPALPSSVETKLSDLAGMSDEIDLDECADGTERLNYEHAGTRYTFRVTTLAEWEAIGRTIRKAKRNQRGLFMRKAVLSLLVAPGEAEADALFKLRPALPTVILKKMSDALGGDAEALEKKA